MPTDAVNLSVMVVYLAGVFALGVFMSRYVKTVKDFFLAGRALNYWVVAGTIIATNVAAIWLVGPAGGAYKSGASTVLIAWSGNMIAALSAILFVPRWRRLRITTVTEILEARYGVGVRLLPVLAWLAYYTLFSGAAMYTFSLTMKAILGWPQWVIILVVGPLVVGYCFAAGLLAVAFTDVVQAFLIILGGVIMLPLAMKAVGGYAAFVSQAPKGHFLLWQGGGVGWKSIFTWIVTGLPFWCTSQYMLQRTFGARTVRDGARGLALAALLTGPLTLTYILAGLCGSILYSGPKALSSPDMVLPSMLRDVLPIGLGGLFLAALVAASNSTASSLLNSVATLFENDVYRRFLPGRPEKHYTLMGRLATLLAGACAIGFAVVLSIKKKDLLYVIYNIMVIVEPPVFVICAGALFWRRPSTRSAAITFVASVLFNLLAFWRPWGEAQSPLLSWCNGWGYGDIGVWGFAFCLALFVLTSLLFPNRRTAETDALWARLARRRPAQPTPVTWAGLALAAAAFIAFVLCATFETRLPQPANIFIFLALMMLFILGLFVAIPGVVAEEDLDEAERESDEAGRREIDASLVSRVVGSWRTWAALYLLCALLGFGLYWWG